MTCFLLLGGGRLLIVSSFLLAIENVSPVTFMPKYLTVPVRNSAFSGFSFMLESSTLAKMRSRSCRCLALFDEYVTRSSTQKDAQFSRPENVISMALVNTLEAFLLPWMERLNFMMQLPDFLETKKVTPLDCSVNPI